MTPAREDLALRSSLLRFVPAPERAALLAAFEPVRHAFGEEIVVEGEPADAWYIVLSGRARVIKRQPDGSELMLGRLLAGDEFGEAALAEGGVRNATVRASTTIELLRLSRLRFAELAAAHPELERALVLQARWRALHGFLYQFSDFGRLPAAALQALMAALEPRRVAAGEAIVRAGEPAGPMLILEAGRAVAWRQGQGGRERLAVYRPGDWFGERSFLLEEARAATVEALEDCSLLELPVAAARGLCERHPEFAQRLHERQDLYRQASGRLPLDFQELLPAEAAAPPVVPEVAEDEAARGRRGRIRRFPFVPQIDEMDCGAACLAMVCRHYGIEVSLTRLRALCHTSHEGTSLSGLCAAAAELGLPARALKVSARHLDDLPVPSICHWQGHHWVVVHGVDDRHVWIADPALGRRRLPRAEFLAYFSGYSALFEQAPEPRPQPGTPVSPLQPLLQLLAPHRGDFALAAGLALLVSLLTLLFPVATQFVVDQVIVDGDVDLLAVVLGAIAAALAGLVLAQGIQQYLLAWLALRIDTSALDLLTRRLLALPMSYFLSRRTGDIQRRLDGIRQVRQFFVQYGIGGALSLLQLLAALLLMLAYSPALAAVYLATLPAYGLLLWLSRRWLRPLYAEIEEAHARYASQQIDAIRGIEAVKAGAGEGGFRDAMLGAFLKVSRQQFRGHFLALAYDGALQALGLLTLIAFLWFGAQQVIAGTLSVGALVAFNSLLALASAALVRALGAWDEWQYVTVLLARLADVFEHEPEQGRDRARLLPVRTLEGRIHLEDVGFRYGGPGAPEILSGIHLELAPGRSYALVGRSGSGKTTLVKLIAGLLEPSAGTIRFDHVDSRQLNHRDLRRQIGYVLQENHLFDGSVLANIAFGEAEPDFERALRAAQLAHAHEFIARLPHGYETRVGDGGLALSGGQRQRIAIARALYRDPPVLIFDEATSALDSESERAIQHSLADIARGRTLIVIAHRLSTVREADEIIVIEQGRIVEHGSHDALLARRGLYFHLHSQQLAS